MKAFVLTAAVMLLLNGCATIKLTQKGAVVRPVTAHEKEESCAFIDVVEGFGAPLTGGMRKAMTDVRNDTGHLGGNAMYIISTRTAPFSGGCCYNYVTAEALSCKFPKKKDK